ncbi:hypothetical protein P3W45_001637 [Vairimorpha bombi]|jgi:amino acid permease
MKEGLSTFGGTVTIITSMLGVGINFMPAAFRSIGYIQSVYFMMVVTFLTGLTLFSVAYSAHLNKSRSTKTYSSIAYDTNKYFGCVVDFCIVLSQVFVGISYHKYMVSLILLFLFGVDDKHPNFHIINIATLFGTGILLYFLSLLKDLSSLKFTSYLSVFSVFYLIFFILSFYLAKGAEIQSEGFNSYNNDYGFGMGFFILGMCCQVNMVSVYTEVENKSLRSLVCISTFGSVIGGMIYSAVGYFGYKIYGNSIGENDLIKNFCYKDSPMNLALKDSVFRICPKIAVIGSIIVLFGSFPLQLNPASSILLKIMGKTDDKSRTYLITALFGAMLFINSIPGIDLNVFLKILGATFSNGIAFLFPSIYVILAIRKINLLSTLSACTILFSIAAGGYILSTVSFAKN